MATQNVIGAVEKNIPLPESDVGGSVKYPLGEMEVGDSFWTNVDLDRLAPVISSYGKRHNRKYSRRKMDGGFRVWRVA